MNTTFDMKMLAMILFATWSSLAQQVAVHRPILIDEMGIEVVGESREIAFTNKDAGVFYTETNAEHRTGWQGWRVVSKEMLEDYRIIVGGSPLRRQDVRRTLVLPHQLKRFYENGIEETVTLLDSLNALVVEIDHVTLAEVSIYPLFSDAMNEEDYETGFNKDILTIVHKNHEVRTPEENYPAAISVSWAKENLWTGGFYDSTRFERNFSPAFTRTVNPAARHVAVFTVGDSAYHAIMLMKFVAKNVDSLIQVRKNRMERVLNASYIRTDDRRFDKALNWAKISLDNLVMNQTGKGIFAGLPWFDNYWGRDTYISLPGATLVTGNFSAAREILRTFAASQDTVASSPTFGRIPNLITTSSTSYNTADGTPWFTIALGEYYRYSNDGTLIRELYPAVKRGIEGTLKHHVDAQFFLTHGDAETWMDAVGPSGPWSPRGTRANDIQGHWFRQLRTGAQIAALNGDDASATTWNEIAGKLGENYRKHFVDTVTRLATDHLRADGTPAKELRPNQLFTDEILGDEQLTREMFSSVTQSLVYPHGVASLSQDDSKFHPYHHYPQAYVQDAAYHNGIVWNWLSGKWIDLATRFGVPDLAFTVTSAMVNQILERGAVGTLAELSDAVPRPGEKQPRLSGAFSQAWSLAEFVRTAYQDYVGASVDIEGAKQVLTLCPGFPKEISKVSAKLIIGERTVLLDYDVTSSGTRITVTPDSLGNAPFNYRVDVVRGSKRFEGLRGSIPSRTSAVVTLVNNMLTETIGRDTKNVVLSSPVVARADSMMERVHLATPFVKEGLATLKGPSYRVLSNREIKASVDGRPIIDVADAENDDNGNGSYSYPRTPMLKPGSLDITHFTVSTNKENVRFTLRFRELSNPGWHPEYGFQLTYIAIAIDKDRKENSGQRKVGMNAQYTFSKKFGFENIIYVGGGVSIADGDGNTLAAYIPAEGDEANPLGDDQTKTIDFTIPAEILGTPSAAWRYAVLVGAQDDHGGAGIGEFRTVGVTRSEWSGGGKKNANDSNIYDVILPK